MSAYDPLDRLMLAWTLVALTLIVLTLGAIWLCARIDQHRRSVGQDPRAVPASANGRKIRPDDWDVGSSRVRF